MDRIITNVLTFLLTLSILITGFLGLVALMPPPTRAQAQTITIPQTKPVINVDKKPVATTTIPQISTPTSPVSSWPTKIEQWRTLIEKYSQTNNLDPDLVAAVMIQESGGNPRAVSRSGAIGLMQIMPKYHSCATFDPTGNIACGTQILAYYIRRANGHLGSGLAAYNAGESGRDRYGRGWYYAGKVLTIYQRFQQ